MSLEDRGWKKYIDATEYEARLAAMSPKPANTEADHVPPKHTIIPIDWGAVAKERRYWSMRDVEIEDHEYEAVYAGGSFATRPQFVMRRRKDMSIPEDNS